MNLYSFSLPILGRLKSKYRICRQICKSCWSLHQNLLLCVNFNVWIISKTKTYWKNSLMTAYSTIKQFKTIHLFFDQLAMALLPSTNSEPESWIDREVQSVSHCILAIQIFWKGRVFTMYNIPFVQAPGLHIEIVLLYLTTKYKDTRYSRIYPLLTRS